MPGIVGIIRPHGSDETPAEMARMLACMRHESFHASGFLVSDDGGLAVGWVGIDGQAADAMVAQSATTSVVLTGELFDGRCGGSDNAPNGAGKSAERVLRAYEAEGASCLSGLNGWFGGVIHNRRRKQVVLFNDRYGHARLYWHRDAEGFYFASEAKAILALRPSLRSLDPRGLGEWLSCGCVLQNRSLFRNILLLPPASAWGFGPDGTAVEQTYFRPEEWENQAALGIDEYLGKLGEILPGVLKRYLTGDRKSGMSLTGGLDGRMIMAWAGLDSGALPCYTFNGPYRECADTRIARRIAAACGQSHQVIPLGEGFFRDFADLAAKSVYLSDGTMDATGAVELYMNRHARQIAPARVTGNYGSEILREYVAFRAGTRPVPGIDGSLAEMMPQAAETYGTEAKGHKLSFIAFKQVPWHHHARSSIERSQLTVRSPYLDNDLVALAFQAPAEGKTVEALLRLIARRAPQLGIIPNDRGVTYPGGGRMGRLKRTAHEFVAKAEYAYDYGMPQWLARLDHWAAPLRLERRFLGHQKFCHFRVWYRDRLADGIREILLDPRTLARNVFEGAAIERVVGQHLKGTHNHTLALHKLLSLELLFRSLIEQGPRTPSPVSGAHLTS